MKLDLPKPKTETKTPRFNFYKTDAIKFKEYLSNVNWNELLKMNPDDGWEFFQNTLHKGFENYVPKTTTKSSNKQPAF